MEHDQKEMSDANAAMADALEERDRHKEAAAAQSNAHTANGYEHLLLINKARPLKDKIAELAAAMAEYAAATTQQIDQLQQQLKLAEDATKKANATAESAVKQRDDIQQECDQLKVKMQEVRLQRQQRVTALQQKDAQLQQAIGNFETEKAARIQWEAEKTYYKPLIRACEEMLKAETAAGSGKH